MTQTDPFVKTADPFGQADGSAPDGDAFDSAPRPESSFISAKELKPDGMSGKVGALVLIRCDNAEIVKETKPKEYGGDGVKTQEKLIADTAVLDGEYAGRSQEKMWWMNDAITGAVRRMKKNSPVRPILGRVVEVPSFIEKGNAKKAGDNFAGYARTSEELPAAYEAFKAGKRGRDQVSIAIVLAEHTEDDAVKAREFLAANPEFLR